jgi:acetylornithine deacetylase
MPEIDFYQHCEPHDVGTDFELVKLFMKNQKEAVLSGFPAGCDARHLEKTGIRTIVYGPGHIRDAHGVDEKVRIEDYMQAIRTNALTIMDWCGVEEV